MALYMGSMRICTSVEGETASGDTKSIVRYSGLNVVPASKTIDCSSQNEYSFDNVRYVDILTKSKSGNAFSLIDVRFEKDSRNYIRLDCNNSYDLRFRIVINNQALVNYVVGSTYDLDSYTDVLVEFDFLINKVRVIGSKQGSTPVTVFTVDFSQYDYSAINTFYLKTTVGRWGGLVFSQSVFINYKIDYTDLLNFHYQYGQYNSIASLSSPESFYNANLVQAGGTGMTVETISPTHKIITANINSSTYFPMGAYNSNFTATDGLIVTKFRVTEITTSCELTVGVGTDKNYYFDYDTGAFISANSLTPELNKWYLVVYKINNTPSYTSTYAVKASGQFVIETVGLFLMTAQSVNICSETCGGLYFSGTIPFNTDRTYWTTPSFTIGENGRNVPMATTTVVSNGGIYMYNGTAWKVIGT